MKNLKKVAAVMEEYHPQTIHKLIEVGMIADSEYRFTIFDHDRQYPFVSISNFHRAMDRLEHHGFVKRMAAKVPNHNGRGGPGVEYKLMAKGRKILEIFSK